MAKLKSRSCTVGQYEYNVHTKPFNFDLQSCMTIECFDCYIIYACMFMLICMAMGFQSSQNTQLSLIAIDVLYLYTGNK